MQLASLELPAAPVALGWGDLFRDLEGERQSPVEALDDPGGHLPGGVPVAGADTAATLQLSTAAALVTHELIDDPRRDRLDLQPGRKAVPKIMGPRSCRCPRSVRR
jgi:hypothetical protein